MSIDGGSTIAIGTFGSGNPAGGESGVQCPNNNSCSGVVTASTGQTTFVQFQATAGSGPQGYATIGQTYEVNGQFVTQQQYEQYQQSLIQAYISTQRQTLAAALGLASLGDCADGLVGGNLNCVVSSKVQSDYVYNDDNNCLSNSNGTDYRCGSFSTGYSLHFETNDSVITVHMDTMNPGLLIPFSVQFPGVLVHFGVDVIGGHTFFSTGVPH